MTFTNALLKKSVRSGYFSAWLSYSGPAFGVDNLSLLLTLSALLGIFQEKLDTNAKSANRDIFFKIFLVKRRLRRIIEGIDKMDKVKGVQKALRLMSGDS